MPKEKIIKYSLIHSLGVLAYVFLVAILLQNGDKLFGKNNNLASVMAFLMLFVFSATVVGGLVLAKPLMLYLDGQKKEAIKMLLCTLGWLLILMAAVFAMMILF